MRGKRCARQFTFPSAEVAENLDLGGDCADGVRRFERYVGHDIEVCGDDAASASMFEFGSTV